MKRSNASTTEANTADLACKRKQNILSSTSPPSGNHPPDATHASSQYPLNMVSNRVRSSLEFSPSRTPSPLPNKRIRIGGSETCLEQEPDTLEKELDMEISTSTAPTLKTGTSTVKLDSQSSKEKPFPLMSLPAEIRNEIYRACLTRPFNICLSKYEPIPRSLSIMDPLGEDAQNIFVDNAFPDVTTLLNPRRDILSHPDLHRWLNERSRAVGQQVGQPGPVSTHDHQTRSRLDPRAHMRTLAPAGLAMGPQTPRANNGIEQSEIYERKPAPPRPQDADPLIVNLLRVSKTVYHEARSILYSENHFTLSLDTALSTLAALHQRSRRQIKYVEIEIPCYNEILERFQETVRLSLRYCWGLRKFVIHMPFILPGTESTVANSSTTVYANGFDILRWLPRQCEVVLKGNVCAEIEAVVSRNANLAKTLDELAYARRQLISNENEHS